jgi:hypothetical protein
MELTRIVCFRRSVICRHASTLGEASCASQTWLAGFIPPGLFLSKRLRRKINEHDIRVGVWRPPMDQTILDRLVPPVCGAAEIAVLRGRSGGLQLTGIA